MDIESDLFALFDIDLQCDDAKVIEAAITKKQQEWSAKRNDLRHGQEYAKHLGQVQGYRDVLLDPAARAAHRQTVVGTRNQEVKQREAQARAALRPLTAEGSIARDALERFVKEYAHPAGPTEADLRKMVKVPVVEPAADEGEKSTPRMPSTLYGELRGHLGVLGFPHLYAFLGVPPGADDSDIRRQQARLQEEWRVKPASPELSAANKLLGMVAVHLLDAIKRAAYDNSLRDELAEPFLRALGPVLSARSVTPAQVEALISVAAECKIERDEALQIIRQEARKAGAALTVIDVVEKQRICGKCRYPNSQGATNCADCGMPLDIQCPSCGTLVATSEGACPKCRMTMARILTLPDELHSLRTMLQSGQVAAAITDAQAALAHYGSNCRDIVQFVEQANKVYESAQARLSQAQHELSARRLHKTDALLAELLATDQTHPGAHQLADQVRDDLERVGKLIAEAKEAETRGKQEAAAEGYLRAVRLCADSTEATQGLQRLPPASPTHLRVQAQGQMVRLEWSSSTSPGVEQYLIVRRVGGSPSSASEGTEVARVAGTSYDDLSAPIGESCYYGVFALRGAAASSQGAVSSPVTAIAEVANLVASADDGLVNLSWDLPGRVTALEVCRRHDRPPDGPGDGQTVPLSTETSLRDASVKNGTTYYYRVTCLYQSTGGQLVRSSGKVVTAKPEPLPKPLDELHVQMEDDDVLLTWVPPAFGDICIIRHREPLLEQIGAALPRARVGDLGAVLHSSGGNHARDQQTDGCIQYYTAVTLGAQMAVIGATERFVNLADATAARLESNAGRLQAYWKWPTGTTVAKVGWRADGYPTSSDDPRASFRRISKSEFDQDGRCTIQNPPEGDCHLAVFVGVNTPQGELFAGGQSPGARALHYSGPAIAVSYRIKKSLFGGQRALLFRASSSCVLPPALLVSKPGNLPMDINSGSPVQELPELRIGPTEVEVPIMSASRDHYVKLFLKDPQAYSRLIINHPPKDSLKIH